MAVTIDYNSANRVANKLRRMARNTPSVTDSAMKAHAQKMRRILKGTPYVPRMRNQRYRRTGNLANRWRVVKVRSGRYSVINGAIATADAAITTEIGGTAVTGGAITIAYSGSAAGDVDSASPSALNILTAGQALEIITDGASANTVAATFTIIIRR